MKKICKYCGNEFDISYRTQKYCSPRCSIKGKKLSDKKRYDRRRKLKQIKKRKCPVCGVIFPVSHERQKYCSPKCKNKAGRKRYKIICEQCGKVDFKDKPNQKYCSIKCYGIAQRSENYGFRHNWRKTKTDKKYICKWCGKNFDSWRPENERNCCCKYPCGNAFAQYNRLNKKWYCSIYPKPEYIRFFQCEICGEWTYTRSKNKKHDVCEKRKCQSKFQYKNNKEQYKKDAKKKYIKIREQLKSEFIPIEFTCLICGEDSYTTFRNRSTRYCVDCKAKYGSNKCVKKISKQRRRHLKRLQQPNNSENVYLVKLYFRDKGKCQICKRKLKLSSKVPNKRAPTIDHIVPLSKGGEHNYKNCQLVCFHCNSVKCNHHVPEGDQLRIC